MDSIFSRDNDCDRLYLEQTKIVMNSVLGSIFTGLTLSHITFACASMP